MVCAIGFWYALTSSPYPFALEGSGIVPRPPVLLAACPSVVGVADWLGVAVCAVPDPAPDAPAPNTPGLSAPVAPVKELKLCPVQPFMPGMLARLLPGLV